MFVKPKGLEASSGWRGGYTDRPSGPRPSQEPTPMPRPCACVRSKPTQSPRSTYPRCFGTSGGPHTPAALRRMQACIRRVPRWPGMGSQMMSTPQSSPSSLQSQAPPTSCAFINDLLDLGFLCCALSGFLGWRGWGISSCLRLHPHVGVNFLVRILLLCTRKAGNHQPHSYRLVLARHPRWGTTLSRVIPPPTHPQF